MSGEFWLDDRQWRRLAPLLPNKPRGVPRADDRRVIGGIIHGLRSGGRWVDAPIVHGPRKARYNRFVRWAAKGVWQAVFEALAAESGPPAELPLDSTHVQAHRRAAGGKGGSAPRRSASAAAGLVRLAAQPAKIHALSDGLGRPLAFLLTPGQAADCRAAEILLRRVPSGALVMADRACDTDAARAQIQAQGAVPAQGMP